MSSSSALEAPAASNNWCTDKFVGGHVTLYGLNSGSSSQAQASTELVPLPTFPDPGYTVTLTRSSDWEYILETSNIPSNARSLLGVHSLLLVNTSYGYPGLALIKPQGRSEPMRLTASRLSLGIKAGMYNEAKASRNHFWLTLTTMQDDRASAGSRSCAVFSVLTYPI